METVICVECSKTAETLEERKEFFGRVYRHKAIYCKECRQTHTKEIKRRKQEEYKARVVVEGVDAEPLPPANIKKLMEVFDVTEKIREDKELEDFIGL